MSLLPVAGKPGLDRMPTGVAFPVPPGDIAPFALVSHAQVMRERQ
jgi:hypothetical protein